MLRKRTTRVAFLLPEVATSYGWGRYGVELARALDDQGVEIVALIQSRAARPDDSAWLADVRPVLPHLYPPIRGFLMRSLASTMGVRRGVADCDLLHVVAEPYALLATLAAGSKPLVVTAHGTYVPQTVGRRFVGTLYRWAYQRAHLIAVSNYTAGQVRLALPSAHPTVIRNGVHFERFQTSAPPPQKLGPTVLASGGIKARKGTHLLVAAMPEVRAHVPDAQLVVTGGQHDTDYLAQVQDQIARLSLKDCVHLPGQIPEPDLFGWYQHADVFALPSLNVGGKFEGFGLVFLEASACGLPVIGTTGSGIEEAVIANQTGLLVPQNDVPALTEAIVRLLTDDALRVQMGATGREYARTQDWSVMARQVIALYERILA